MNADALIPRLEARLTQHLAAKHMRRTVERSTLLTAAVALDRRFTAEELWGQVAEGPVRVSRATCFHTVKLFCEAGILRALHLDAGATLYEVDGGAVRSRLHLVCSRCGKVRDVADVAVERLVGSRSFPTFNPEYFTLCIYGLCSRCQRRGGKGRRKAPPRPQRQG